MVVSLASIIMITTAVRIESLNLVAQHWPRRELREGGSPVAWRQWPWTDEVKWRAWWGPKVNGEPVTRELTDDERACMVADTRRAIANNQLRDLVWSWGLLQYVLAPLTVLLSAYVAFDRAQPRFARGIAAVPMVIGVVAGSLACFRGYLASLD